MPVIACVCVCVCALARALKKLEQKAEEEKELRRLKNLQREEMKAQLKQLAEVWITSINRCV